MTDKPLYGNTIRPLRNVAALVGLQKKLRNRAFGLPGMGVFYGPTGFGKSMACSHLAAQHDAIHITIQKIWTIKSLLEAILFELSIVPKGTRTNLLRMVNEGLAVTDRTLIIDEADYAIAATGMIELIRDIHDGSSAPTILIGMEEFPQKLRKWELVDGRVYSWEGAEPTDMKDAKMLASLYCPRASLDDALLERIVRDNKGSARRISADLAHVNQEAMVLGVEKMTLDQWGDAPFLRGEAPAPRRGLT